MEADLSMEELEQEQLDYLRRNSDQTHNIPSSSEMYPNVLERPLDDPVILTPEQEKRLVSEVLRRQMENKKSVIKDVDLSFKRYFDMLSNSFVDVMEDFLSFDGDLEKIPNILTKDDRLVLFGTLLMIIVIFVMVSKKLNLQV
jgi:hypothetical protein